MTELHQYLTAHVEQSLNFGSEARDKQTGFLNTKINSKNNQKNLTLKESEREKVQQLLNENFIALWNKSDSILSILQNSEVKA